MISASRGVFGDKPLVGGDRSWCCGGLVEVLAVSLLESICEDPKLSRLWTVRSVLGEADFTDEASAGFRVNDEGVRRCARMGDPACLIPYDLINDSRDGVAGEARRVAIEFRVGLGMPVLALVKATCASTGAAVALGTAIDSDRRKLSRDGRGFIRAIGVSRAGLAEEASNSSSSSSETGGKEVLGLITDIDRPPGARAGG
eukprot:Blabericola_migrator_1__5475@NODE_2799_length_2339_cov_136_812940_g997_i1_p2_GENE_NODE_2799_length_2339_cov_136_812940_g997_i1NODE_2799_length_2339_cov_136_812940_g997_i1_p2_ORF_typecomplete_len201_score11_77DUF4904/PF16247_5/0_32_NODE_2799_length_2339_cov_136_812940_g997_i15441146